MAIHELQPASEVFVNQDQPFLGLSSNKLPEIKGFALIDVLGSGGMGIVYRAVDLSLNREVAIKCLLPEFTNDVELPVRFIEESQVTGQLQHPGIPSVYMVGKLSDGRPFLVMKLIQGTTLADCPPESIALNRLTYLEAIARAVGYAHAHGVIHRDLKPNNIMVGAFGEVQVMDWGLAKVLNKPASNISQNTPSPTEGLRSPRSGSCSFTRVGDVVGTLSCMAPEQAAGMLDVVNSRADVFGLGAILYWMLTGKYPIGMETTTSVNEAELQRSLTTAYATLAATVAEPGVIDLCKRCLSYQPMDRPADGTAVANEVVALRRQMEDRAKNAALESARAGVRIQEQRKRRWVWVGLAVSLLLGLLVTSDLAFWANRKRQEAQEAERVATVARGEAEAASVLAQKEKVKAEEQAAIAQAERKNALEQSAFAKGVKDFFQFDILQLATPDKQHAEQSAGLKYDADLTLREVLIRSAKNLEGKFENQPLVEAEIRWTFGNTLLGMGRPELAKPHFDRMLKLCLEHMKPEDRMLHNSYNCLAVCLSGLGDAAAALPLFEKAHALQLKHMGPEHAETIKTECNLASTHVMLGNMTQAEDMCKRTIQTLNNSTLPNKSLICHAQYQLANVYFAKNAFKESISLHEETLSARKKLLGEDHPDTLSSMSALSRSLSKYNRNEEAEALRVQALKIQQEKLGSNHKETLNSMYNLGVIHFNAQRYNNALIVFQEVYDNRKATLGEAHPETMLCRNQMAGCYFSMRDYQKTLEICDELINLSIGKLGKKHPITFDNMMGKIMTLYTLKKADECIKHTKELIQWMQEVEQTTKKIDVEQFSKAVFFQLRMQAFQQDAKACRETAQLWEKYADKQPRNMYAASRLYAITADVQFVAGTSDAIALAKADADKAIAWLEKAIKAGHSNRPHLEQDSDFKSIRQREDFQALLKLLPAYPQIKTIKQ